MKFFSQQANYRVMLKPGLPGNSMTGVAPVPGKSVKFEGGVVVVPDTDIELLDMMRKSESYGVHFVAEEDRGMDPFAKTRKDSEPVHILQNIKHGSIAEQQTSKPILDQKQLIEEAAKALATDIAKEMVKSMLPDIVEKVRADVAAAQPKPVELAPEFAIEAPTKAKTKKS